ncbi:hypothetical protein FSP39_015129, partial [Pinctada imbricata]
LTVLQTRFDDGSQAGHNLYVKEHRVKDTDESKPRDKTLMIVNVPPYCNEECMKRIFSHCGKVMHVYFHDKPNSGPPKENKSKYFPLFPPNKGFKVAYLVFKSPASVKKAIQLPYDKPLILSTEEHPLQVGVKKWTHEFKEKRVDIEEMQIQIDEYMKEYDRRVEEEKQRALDMEGVPDDDGWITVTRHGKNKGLPRSENMEKKVTAKERRKKKQKEFENFYRFQMSDTKKNRIADLRKKFEEDKQRIALMKASRKFKPY